MFFVSGFAGISVAPKGHAGTNAAPLVCSSKMNQTIGRACRFSCMLSGFQEWESSFRFKFVFCFWLKLGYNRLSGSRHVGINVAPNGHAGIIVAPLVDDCTYHHDESHRNVTCDFCSVCSICCWCENRPTDSNDCLALASRRDASFLFQGMLASMSRPTGTLASMSRHLSDDHTYHGDGSNQTSGA